MLMSLINDCVAGLDRAAKMKAYRQAAMTDDAFSDMDRLVEMAKPMVDLTLTPPWPCSGPKCCHTCRWISHRGSTRNSNRRAGWSLHKKS